MKNQRSNRSSLTAAAVAFMLLATLGASAIMQTARANGADKAKTKAKTAATKNIVETAVGAGSFKTLVKALEAADLVGALKGEGPFTVFAPTDEAFAKLPDGALAELLRPENKDKLRAVLLYHVVPGRVVASDVMKLDGREVKTLEGSAFMVKTKGGVMVNDARVVKTDVMTSNGVIHVIDTVIMPNM
jgi:uncharacterized surface protein with fasciclin (FAS1) repeats